MPSFKLSILTPVGKIYENTIESLVAPGTAGSFGVMANHAPMLASTSSGFLKVKEPDEIFFNVGSGVLEISSGDANFLADSAERVDSLPENKV